MAEDCQRFALGEMRASLIVTLDGFMRRDEVERGEVTLTIDMGERAVQALADSHFPSELRPQWTVDPKWKSAQSEKTPRRLGKP